MVAIIRWAETLAGIADNFNFILSREWSTVVFSAAGKPLGHLQYQLQRGWSYVWIVGTQWLVDQYYQPEEKLLSIYITLKS